MSADEIREASLRILIAAPAPLSARTIGEMLVREREFPPQAEGALLPRISKVLTRHINHEAKHLDGGAWLRMVGPKSDAKYEITAAGRRRVAEARGKAA